MTAQEPPAEAITAAHAAADEGWAPHAPQSVHDAVDRVLDAARPHLVATARAAQREEDAQFVEGYQCPCGEDDCASYDALTDIAGLLRQDGGT